jgi:hypothetical protein
MLTIKATYDGSSFKPLPTEVLPEVKHEIPVAIVFLEEATWPIDEATQREAALTLRAIRERTLPLDMDIKDMVEEGRDR